MSDFSSSLHFKVAKWGNAQPAMRETSMAEGVQLCQTHAPNCWLGYSENNKPMNEQHFFMPEDGHNIFLNSDSPIKIQRSESNPEVVFFFFCSTLPKKIRFCLELVWNFLVPAGCVV